MNAVGVDIFAGGFTLGVERYFRVLAHLEHGPYGVGTFRLNRPHVPVFHPPSSWPLSSLAGRVDFMFCNPPCAIVSIAGAGMRHGHADNWRRDPRTDCIRDAVDVAVRVRPRTFALESVTRLYTHASELVHEQVAKLLAVGYGVTHLLINAGWHGAPQTRRRYFLLGHLEPLAFERLNYAPPDTVDEVLGTVEDPGWIPPARPEVSRLAARLQPGEGLRGLWERENPPETHVRGPNGVVGRPRMMEGRMRGDRPAGVFFGDFYWHPREARRLGLNEAKALCGFPADYQFARPAAAFSEMARGVMPPVADWLARQVKRSLEGDYPSPPYPAGSRVHVHDIRRPPT